MNRSNGASGEQNVIKRDLGLVSATAIVVANMIGAGIFTTSGLMAANLPGPGWVLACWIFGGAIAISGALCYGELATRMPDEGGEYLYLKRIYHPALGFLTGWTSLFIGFSAAIAGSALGFSAYLFAGVTAGSSGLGAATVTIIQKGTAVSVIAVFTTLHYCGLRWGARVQNALTAIKVLLLVGLALAGMLMGGGKWDNVIDMGSGGNGYGWMGFGTAMIIVMFAYSGWNASAYIAGEVKRPRRNLPLSLILGTFIVMTLYLAVNLFVFRSTTYGEVRGTLTIVETAGTNVFGDRFGDYLAIMAAIALLSSLSAFIMIGPRVYYAMARDRLFFPFAAKVHPRFRVPTRSILLQGAIAVVMVLVGSFEQIVIYIGFSLSIFPWLAILGLFLARRRGIGEESAARVRGWPAVPLFFLASSFGLMVMNYINRPVESTAAVVTVLLGVPCYMMWVRKVGARAGQ